MSRRSATADRSHRRYVPVDSNLDGHVLLVVSGEVVLVKLDENRELEPFYTESQVREYSIPVDPVTPPTPQELTNPPRTGVNSTTTILHNTSLAKNSGIIESITKSANEALGNGQQSQRNSSGGYFDQPQYATAAAWLSDWESAPPTYGKENPSAVSEHITPAIRI